MEVSSQLHVPAALSLGNKLLVIIGYEAGWAPEPDLRETVLEVVDWIHLAQDSDQWWTLVNRVLKLPVT
jgi:hypothetical protein